MKRTNRCLPCLLLATLGLIVVAHDTDAGVPDSRRGIVKQAEAPIGFAQDISEGVMGSDGSFLSDVSVFQNCFGLSPSPLCLVPFDCDTNGEIDLSDYAALMERSVGLNSVPCGMTLIPGGEIDMGDHHDGMADALPVHAIFVDSFYMDIHEVHNQQYADYLVAVYSQGLVRVVDGLVYSASGDEVYCEVHQVDADSRIRFVDGVFNVTPGMERHPMLEVSWYGAAAYANWLSTKSGRALCYDPVTWECDFDADGFRLPTEAEWEYAARGGERTPYRRYPWGDDVVPSNGNFWDSQDPYEAESSPGTTPVGYFDGGQTPAGPPMLNGYGLNDMSGNAWEWCHDQYNNSYYATSEYDNPRGPEVGSNRVLRGGSWLDGADALRCAVRYDRPAHRCGASYGFRLVLALE